MNQEDPEPPQIKEEQEELCTSQEEEQLELKQETDVFMVTLTDEESVHSGRTCAKESRQHASYKRCGIRSTKSSAAHLSQF